MNRIELCFPKDSCVVGEAQSRAFFPGGRQAAVHEAVLIPADSNSRHCLRGSWRAMST